MADVNDSFVVDNVVEEVGKALHRLPDPLSLRNRGEFMTAGVDAMNSLLTLGKIAVCLQTPTGRGYTRRHAPLVGLIVRMVKLFEGILDQTVKDRGDLAGVFLRPLYEAHIKFEYLMRSGPQSAKSFIITSFRPEKEMLVHLNSLKKQRPLQPIETRIRRSILNHLKLVGLTQKQLLSQTTWDIDGKNMRSLLQALQRDLEYSFSFGSSSHFVHGTWYDLWVYHLQRQKGRYHPDARYTRPDPRYLISPTLILANSLTLFIRHFRLDPKGVLRQSIEAVWSYIGILNDALETVLAQEGSAT